MTKSINKINKVIAKKEWNKNKKKNPLVFKHYVFWLCQTKESLENNYMYFLFTKTYSRHVLTENNSPRFKSEAEALAFAKDNKLKGLIPG